MKIAIDLRPLASGSVSGIPEYTRSLTERLVRTDRENEYVLFFNAFRRTPPRLVVPSHGVRMVHWRVPNRLLDLSFRSCDLPKLDRVTGASVVLNPHFNACAVSGNARRVVTFHDLSFLRAPEWFSPRARLWHLRQDPRAQARAASRIIAVSEATKRDLVERYGVSEEKIAVVHSGVDPFFTPPAEADHEALVRFRRAHRLDDPFILFVGTVEPRKNVIALIRAFTSLRADTSVRRTLVIAGSPGFRYDTMVKEAAASPFREDIMFWGFTPKDVVRNLYRAAAVFAYPSLFEGFGFPPLEAQACGLPVVASKAGSLPEILGDSALLADPDDHEALAARMRDVLVNGTLRAELIQKGFENARRFDWEETAKRTRAILEGR